MKSLRASLLAHLACSAVVGQSYTISTVAGGGLPGDTPGAYASLFNPMAVAVDKAGNVFFADGENAVMRMDATTTLVTVVAGNGAAGSSGDNGLATAAQINSSIGIGLDSSGNLYLTDSNTIRRVSNGVITRVAGTNGEFYLPRTVAIDSAGILYIVDSGHNRVVKISNGRTKHGSGQRCRGFQR